MVDLFNKFLVDVLVLKPARVRNTLPLFESIPSEGQLPLTCQSNSPQQKIFVLDPKTTIKIRNHLADTYIIWCEYSSHKTRKNM